MKTVVLLTAKGKNTFARKNVLPVNGKPLLWYPATAAKACAEADDFFVSSDNDEILDIAASLGYKKIRRPAELATANAQHIDTINHALDVIKDEHNLIPDILIILMGNTVCIKKSWIELAIKTLKEDSALTAAIPVYKAQDKHPFRARKLDSNGNLVPYFDFPDGLSSNRQDLPENFFFCHNFWAIRLQNGKVFNNGAAPWKFMGDRVFPIVVEEGFDVHDEDDIKQSEKWLIANSDMR